MAICTASSIGTRSLTSKAAIVLSTCERRITYCWLGEPLEEVTWCYFSLKQCVRIIHHFTNLLTSSPSDSVHLRAATRKSHWASNWQFVKNSITAFLIVPSRSTHLSAKLISLVKKNDFRNSLIKVEFETIRN